MRLANVWSDGGGLKDLWTVVEKFSQVRRISPCPQLQEAMRVFVMMSQQRHASSYLFGNPLRPRSLPKHVAREVLVGLCRRAGLSRVVYPHQFRRYIVTLFLQHHNTLDQAAKFLGHASVSTTYRHYWWVEDGVRGGHTRTAATGC